MIQYCMKIVAAIGLCAVFTGCNPNKVQDIDGNTYKTVTIGTQVWMAGDLKTTRYNDGTAIPLVTDFDTWASLTTPAYSWYNNDDGNKEVFGALYNWYVVDTKKICPKGWHVPSNIEWETLQNFLGGYRFAGGELKLPGTVLWKSPNAGATNSTGFSAVPAGFRSNNGSFNFIGVSSSWWSTAENGDTHADFWVLYYKNAFMEKNVSEKRIGFCIRCLKDE